MSEQYTDDEERVLDVLAWVADGRLPSWEPDIFNRCTRGWTRRNRRGCPRRVWIDVVETEGKEMTVRYGLTRFGRRELAVWRKSKEAE